MVVERTARYNFVALLPFVGLLSGFFTAAIDYPAGKFGGYVLGGVFGAFMAVALAVSGILQGIWKAALLPLATAVAYYFSFMVAGTIELGLSSDWTMGYAPPVSPVSMFAGGVVGGFLVLCATSILVHPKVGIRATALRAFPWSLMGGILGVIGWMLGPSLGIAIWSGIHDLDLTAPTETLQNALLGPTSTSHSFSLFVVWQTGMALVVAIMLRHNEVKFPPREFNRR